MKQLFKMAFRDILRHKRRSIFSAVALGLGLTLLLMFASFIEGEIRGSMATSIKLDTGHIQIQAQNYDKNKNSLVWEDLIAKSGADRGPDIQHPARNCSNSPVIRKRGRFRGECFQRGQGGGD